MRKRKNNKTQKTTMKRNLLKNQVHTSWKMKITKYSRYKTETACVINFSMKILLSVTHILEGNPSVKNTLKIKQKCFSWRGGHDQGYKSRRNMQGKLGFKKRALNSGVFFLSWLTQ